MFLDTEYNVFVFLLPFQTEEEKIKEEIITYCPIINFYINSSEFYQKVLSRFQFSMQLLSTIRIYSINSNC